MKKILVIKHGALGDIINAMGAFSAIRRNHPKDHITIVTSPAYRSLAEQTGFFDEVWVDNRSTTPSYIWNLRKNILKAKFARVYDLQNSNRTAWYFSMLGPWKRPEWSGAVKGCSHPQTRPDRDHLHAFPRFADQLRIAGLDLEGKDELYPDMSWLKGDLSRFNLQDPYVLIVPGSSKDRPYKRWPAEFYGELASRILTRGMTPVLIGGPDDLDAIEKVRASCPQALDLSCKTTFLEVGEIARNARMTIGNDTGPMHLAAAVGCPTVTLLSKASIPELHAPRAKNATVLFKEDLKDLSVDEVEKAC